MLILETMRSVAKNGLVGYGILRGDISCDSFLGSGLSGCSPQGIKETLALGPLPRPPARVQTQAREIGMELEVSNRKHIIALVY